MTNPAGPEKPSNQGYPLPVVEPGLYDALLRSAAEEGVEGYLNNAFRRLEQTNGGLVEAVLTYTLDRGATSTKDAMLAIDVLTLVHELLVKQAEADAIKRSSGL